jgi:hypothetical protein
MNLEALDLDMILFANFLELCLREDHKTLHLIHLKGE